MPASEVIPIGSTPPERAHCGSVPVSGVERIDESLSKMIPVI
ncbi:MAG TPA: hypothetical protein VGG45_09995 [Terracidiphilus sp.]|jgi:hypothetical protein